MRTGWTNSRKDSRTQMPGRSGSYNFALYREYHATTGGIYKSEIKS